MKRGTEKSSRQLRVSNQSIGISEMLEADSSIDVMLFNCHAAVERLRFSFSRTTKNFVSNNESRTSTDSK